MTLFIRSVQVALLIVAALLTPLLYRRAARAAFRALRRDDGELDPHDPYGELPPHYQPVETDRANAIRGRAA